MEIKKITREEFKRVVARKPVVVIPIGSIEQHGPHSVLGTDSFIAETIACEACEQTGTLCAPTIYFALSEHHKGFPGTIWVSHETISKYLLDIAKALSCQGVKRLIFVNGHGGNDSMLSLLSVQLRYELDVISVVFRYYQSWDQ